MKLQKTILQDVLEQYKQYINDTDLKLENKDNYDNIMKIVSIENFNLKNQNDILNENIKILKANVIYFYNK